MTTATQTDINFDHPILGSIELHIYSSAFDGNFTRKFGKRVKNAGGKYTDCRGSYTRRYVTIPLNEKNRPLIEAILVLDGKCDCAILRTTGTQNFNFGFLQVSFRNHGSTSRGRDLTLTDVQDEVVESIRRYRSEKGQKHQYLNGILKGEAEYVEPEPETAPKIVVTENGNKLALSERTHDGFYYIARRYHTGTDTHEAAFDGALVKWNPEHQERAYGAAVRGAWAVYNESGTLLAIVKKTDFLSSEDKLLDKYNHLRDAIDRAAKGPGSVGAIKNYADSQDNDDTDTNERDELLKRWETR